MAPAGEHDDARGGPGGAGARLGAFDVGCVVIGGIVGVGIFFAPQKVAAAVDGPGQMALAWGTGGALALCGAAVFAELSRLAPGYGGTFVYLERSLGRLPAFLYGWANWLVIQAGALAVIGLVMVDNLLRALLGDDAALGEGARVALAAATIGVFTVVNLLGLRVGRRVQNLLTVIKLAAVFGLVLIGWSVAGPEPAPASPSPPAPRPPLLALAAAMLPVMFSFGGWQQGAFVAGAARRPQRDVPLGIAAGVAVVVLAYVTINLTYVGLLGFEGAAQSPTIAADACRAALSPYGLGDVAGRVMAAAITISALGIMNTILLAPPWVLHAMAQRRLFFAAAGRLHPGTGAPVVGVLVQGGQAVLLLVVAHLLLEDSALATLDFLLNGVVFVDWLFYGLCGVALAQLARGRRGELLWRGSPWLGWLFTVTGFGVAAGAVVTAPEASACGAAICALGVLAFGRLRHR